MNISQIHWLGHASFRIDDPTGTIYIDPWKLPPGLPQADLILITHPHYDHFDVGDIKKIAKTTTTIVGVKEVERTSGMRVTVVVPGKRYTIRAWDIETVPAYNVGKEYHKRSEGWVGYVVTLSDGTRLYHTGDTDVHDAVCAVKADILLVPCGGTYTMDADGAARVARMVRPGLVIPMHWGDIVGTREDAERVKQNYDATVILEPLKQSPASP